MATQRGGLPKRHSKALRGRHASVRKPSSTHAKPKPRKVAKNKHAQKRSNDTPARQASASKLLAYVPNSYASALVYDIASGNADTRVAEEAIMLNQMLLNITPSASILAYRSGFSIGSTLYSIAQTIRPREMYEEHVPYLVEFLERAGYYVTYSTFPDKATFRLHGHSVYLGAKIHTFEAGIIAGFISSARHSYTNVVETGCRNDRADTCTFVTSANAEHNAIDSNSMDRFVAHVHSRASSGAYVDTAFSQSYHALVSSILLEHSHPESLSGLMAYMGSSLKSMYDSLPVKRLGPAEYVSNAINLLKLGVPFVNDMRKLDIKLSFDTATSRRGFVELSVAFLNGMLGARPGRIMAIESNKNNSYTITLARQQNAGIT